MNKPRIYVDLNEMVTSDIVLLSKEDTEVDSEGTVITFYEGMPINIYSDDLSDNGEVDNIIAEGVATQLDLSNYPNWQHVKWCCKIDLNSMRHESEEENESGKRKL